MSTIIVTGGLGMSGKWIADALVKEGHEVVIVDLSHPGWDKTPRSNLEFRVADLTDYGAVADVFQTVDPDIVVHWGAIRGPERHPGFEVFQNNVNSAYNVLTNAGERGAKIVNASSESIYGIAFSSEPWLPDYLPIDEKHDTRPEDPYGASKEVAETFAETVVRRYGVDIISIRPSWIQYPGDYVVLDNREHPEDGKPNFWSYVDIRDVVSLVVDAITTEVQGHEPVLCVAENNYMDQPTADLIHDYFNNTDDILQLNSDESVYTTEKAEQLFDWQPAHSWHTAANEDISEPDLFI